MMPYVVTENCDGCRFTDCVDVCPVDCFYGDGNMLYINPDECIDCSACEPACPVEAIMPAEDLPENLAHWEEVNSTKTLDGDLPQMTSSEDPLPGAEAKKAALGF
jgi:ferredoxin